MYLTKVLFLSKWNKNLHSYHKILKTNSPTKEKILLTEKYHYKKDM